MSEASRALNRLAIDYNLVLNWLLPSGGQSLMSAPQTSHIVSAINAVEEAEPSVSSESIKGDRILIL